MEKVTRHARKSTTPKKADEKTNESNSWHEIGRTSVETSVETSGEICNEFGSGSAAKFCGEVAQGCKPFHSVPSFQGKAHERRLVPSSVALLQPSELLHNQSTAEARRFLCNIIYVVFDRVWATMTQITPIGFCRSLPQL
jgi:hypothetical protein